MILNYIKILDDNYVWILSNNKGFSVIIDPGDAKPIIRFIKKNNYHPISILLTHYHKDHINGIDELLINYPKIKIYGPPQENNLKNKINFINENQIINIINYNFFIMSTPGHTKHDVSYYCPPYLFCGDTLFSGGCGKIITGNLKSMFYSLKKISSLPNNTLICCGHEYTLSNLKFARFILPKDFNILKYYKKVEKMINDHKSSLPSLLIEEKKINIFLRTKDFLLQKRVGLKEEEYEEEKCFSLLRKLKDNFYWS